MTTGNLGMRIGWALLGLLMLALAVSGAMIVADRGNPTVAGHPIGPEVTAPGVPASQTEPAGPAPPGPISVAGTKNHKTLPCNGGDADISGVDNIVILTGHCTRVGVSGVRNDVTIEEAGAIVVSGVDNTVRFHSGAPQLEKSGIRNTLERG